MGMDGIQLHPGFECGDGFRPRSIHVAVFPEIMISHDNHSFRLFFSENFIHDFVVFTIYRRMAVIRDVSRVDQNVDLFVFQIPQGTAEVFLPPIRFAPRITLGIADDADPQIRSRRETGARHQGDSGHKQVLTG